MAPSASAHAGHSLPILDLIFQALSQFLFFFFPLEAPRKAAGHIRYPSVSKALNCLAWPTNYASTYHVTAEHESTAEQEQL